MKYIKSFDSWLNEKYPAFNDNHCVPPPVVEEVEETVDKNLNTDIQNLLFSFFHGGEAKFKTKLEEFNTTYECDLDFPTDWTTLTVLDDPEKVYADVDEFTAAYREYIG